MAKLLAASVVHTSSPSDFSLKRVEGAAVVEVANKPHEHPTSTDPTGSVSNLDQAKSLNNSSIN